MPIHPMRPAKAPRRKPRPSLRTLLLLLLLAGLTGITPAAADDLERALEHFEAERYGDALAIIEPLADAGHPRAQFYLGSMYHSGHGVEQDHEREAEWIRRSAEQGFAWAQNMMGRIYLAGRGVEPDAIEAHMWFNLATAQGLHFAYQARERIAEHMTDDEITTAVERARAWQAKPEGDREDDGTESGTSPE